MDPVRVRFWIRIRPKIEQIPILFLIFSVQGLKLITMFFVVILSLLFAYIKRIRNTASNDLKLHLPIAIISESVKPKDPIIMASPALIMAISV